LNATVSPKLLNELKGYVNVNVDKLVSKMSKNTTDKHFLYHIKDFSKKPTNKKFQVEDLFLSRNNLSPEHPKQDLVLDVIHVLID
jgi:hypothetical protein